MYLTTDELQWEQSPTHTCNLFERISSIQKNINKYKQQYKQTTTTTINYRQKNKLQLN